MDTETVRRKLLILRVAYGAAALAAMGVGIAAMMILGRLTAVPLFKPILPAFSVLMVGTIAGFVGVFLFIAWRPYWWAKLLAAMAAMSWLMNAGVTFLMQAMVPADDGAKAFIQGFADARPVVLVSGLVMLGVAITHQIVDPRLGGSWFGREPS